MKNTLKSWVYRLLRWPCTRWSCWRNWRYWLKVLLAVIYFLFLLVVFPIMLWKLFEYHATTYVKSWFIAGLFVLLTLPIFMLGLVQHLTNYTRPNLQRHIVRILWIVPIYSLDSWIALLLPNAAIYFDTPREWYEAYVIYNFLMYLLNYLQDEYNLEEELLRQSKVSQPFPFNCIPPWPMGKVFIQRCKFGVLQYVVVRCIVTAAALITYWFGVYHEGEFTATGAWVYLAAINTISQAAAIHSLLYFYKATSKLLKPIKPVSKFLCIKSIVFFAFWQSVLIALLVKVKVIEESSIWKGYDIDRVQTGLQDFLICIEMFIAAITHYFVFSHKPFVDPAAAQIPCFSMFLRVLDISDVGGDVREQVDIIQSNVRSNVHKITGAVLNNRAQDSEVEEFEMESFRSSTQKEDTPLLRNIQTQNAEGDNLFLVNSVEGDAYLQVDEPKKLHS